MGLDVVELAMAVEDSFALAIPNKDAESLHTPRMLINYIADRLGAQADPGPCLSQRAFYKLRQLTLAELSAAGATAECIVIRPDTALASYFRGRLAERSWRNVQQRLGATVWPRLGLLPSRGQSRRVATFGEATHFLVERCAVAVQFGHEVWTRRQVADVVHRLIQDELGIDITAYTEDSHFIHDMGAS